MSILENLKERKQFIRRLEEPLVTKALFSDVRWAWIWLILRLYAGWQWLQAGWGKINNPAWTGDNAGAAIAGFAQHALTLTTGEQPDVQPLYAWFLENLVLSNPAFWSYLVAGGELLVGIALILGVFTGIAAFFGSFMNMNYLLSGAVSTNPILFTVAILLVLAWRTAGWWGLDRWVLPALGAPWDPGLIFQDTKPGEQRSAEKPGQP